MATILVVDDRSANREWLVTRLGNVGHRLLEASDGAGGLALARAQHPDLIMARILMAAMDGYDFARAVRVDPLICATQIVFYAASQVSAEARLLAQACGVAYIISMPAEPQIILDTVRAALEALPAAPVLATADEFERAHLRLITGMLASKANELRDEIAERHEAETALRLSEERFAKAFRASPAAVTLTRLADGLFVDANDQYLRLLGYDRAEVIGRTAGGLNMYPDPAIRTELVRRLRADGTVRNFEMDLLTKSGERRTVLFSTEEIELGGEAHILATLIDISERKQAERALNQLNAELEQRVQARTAELAANEAKFRTLFNVLPVGVSILDDQRREVESNASLARILKMSSEGLAANPYAERKFINPDGTPMPPEDFPSARVVVEQRPVLNVEVGIITETGDMLWADVSAAPLPVAGFSAVTVTVDLTDRKRIEAALRESEEKFSKAFHASGAGIVISRVADGRILEANDSYLGLLGYPRAEVIGHTTLELRAITPAARERLTARLREHGQVRDMEIEVVTKTGEARTVVTSSEAITLGDEQCMLSILYDITERKQIEQALADERDLLQALMDNIPDTIYFKDRASRFTRINQSQARLLGVPTPETAVGKTDADYQPPHLASEAYAEEQRLLDSGQPLLDRVEFNPTRSGEPRWLSATKVPLKDAAGQVVGLVGISRDVTARMQAEEELQRVNKQLADRVRELSVLNKLEEQLQSCLTITETFPLTAQVLSQLSSSQAGALYVVNPDRTQVTTAGRWGTPAIEPQVFGLDDCWALRRGQVHRLDDEHPGEGCRHLNGAAPAASVCIPLMNMAQALGVLHLRVADPAGARAFDESTEQLAHVVAESVALTWANLTLRESLRQQAIHDPLTGLYNRRFMEESLLRELHRAARNHQSVSVIMMDIDHFKQVNDRLGHETGDAVLRAVGRLLEASSRRSDILCRYGGEEFLLILPEASLKVAGERAEQIRGRVRQMKFGVESDSLGAVTLSLGIAAYPQHGQAIEAVLRAADAALYQSKSEGRDRTSVAPE